MLRIVCLNADNYEGRGAEYVHILYDMVSRNLPDGFPGKFVCFTNDDPKNYSAAIEVRPLPNPGLTGWYHKLSLFQDGLFPQGDRIVYFDLDTVITGPLDEIVKYEGDFGVLRDFYRPNDMGSAVMLWRAGGVSGAIWHSWVHLGFPHHTYGDQGIIEDFFRYRSGYEILQEKFPGDIRS